MSVRYTGEATMDGPALRDVERWKDKIEVRLDNRQVFFLFFGSALVACMLFVLGVLVGKRIESRGRAEAPAVEDPLAILDRFRTQSAARAEDALTFPGKLIVGTGGGTSRVRPPTSARDERLATRESRMAARPVLTAATPVSAAVPGISPSATLPARSARPPAPAGGLKKTVSPAQPADPTPTSDKPAAAVNLPSHSAAVGLSGKSTSPPATSSVETDRAKGHFLLQLSAFQDKDEAEAFARRFPGKNAYVVATDLPGKGVWYRVRVGSFATLKEASSAKTAFEREHNVIAYVAGSGPSR